MLVLIGIGEKGLYQKAISRWLIATEVCGDSSAISIVAMLRFVALAAPSIKIKR
ncbi:MAG TPA: hypothetical protein VKV30_05015 [Candidatus Angelobacter sp.]|nr:hypothetical protein [Candidatus Angelobacter sp.]